MSGSNGAWKSNAPGDMPGLRYFAAMLDRDPADKPDHSAVQWDQRAEEWEKEYSDPAQAKSDDRVDAAVDYLSGKGILGPECDVVDIGCGPGRFVTAFARTARHVLGIDISERMVHYGAAYAQREGVRNASFHVCDFQALDIEKEGLAGKFDLVFSSITPAIHGVHGLEKTMRMSRKYCCNITHIHSENELESRIMREVFQRDRPDPWAKHWHWFYATFNILLLMGYYPEATYNIRRLEKTIQPGPDYIKRFSGQMLSAKECTPENEGRILDWLKVHANAEGLVAETSDFWYGRLLWDVQAKTNRPAIWPEE